MLGDDCSEFYISGGGELVDFEDIEIFGSFICEFYFEVFKLFFFLHLLYSFGVLVFSFDSLEEVIYLHIWKFILEQYVPHAFQQLIMNLFLFCFFKNVENIFD